MRHISFDESTVLREFAKIANDKQLVKVAAEPRAMPAAAPAQPVQAPTVQTQKGYHPFDEQLRAYKLVSALATGQAVTDAVALLKELGSAEFKRFVDGWKQSTDAEGKKKLTALRAKVLPFVKKVQAQVKKMAPNFQEAYLPSIQEAISLLSQASSEVTGIKTAAEKLYDVSGETGKDLVDAAHPGGGTVTELTHSKTKENLVETIVEQQEADIEVARKAPKGTYAALVNLYNKLSKLGFEDKLAGLKESITTIATAEEIVEHTLVTLADDLDRLGFVIQADEVDQLLKKKVAAPPAAPADAGFAKQRYDALNKELANTFVNMVNRSLPGGAYFGQVRTQIAAAAGQGFNAAVAKARELAKEPNYGNYITKAINQSTSSDQIMKMVTEFADAGKAMRGGQPQAEIDFSRVGEGWEMSQTPAGLTGKKQKQVKRDPEVLKLQKEFNRLYKGKYAPIAEDGIMGPQTEAAKLIMRRQEGLEQAQQPASPNQGLENAKKIDIGQMDLQRLTPQVFSMVLQNYRLTQAQLGKDNILDLSRTLRSYIERATKEVYNSGANFKDQASRDKAIVNMAFSMFTKEVPKEDLLSK